uniref:Uncharacterized protein n=1 Tax=Romanomermis culicivorax TaxID=13658 RepID=A0A915ISF6_ROMCU
MGFSECVDAFKNQKSSSSFDCFYGNLKSLQGCIIVDFSVRHDKAPIANPMAVQNQGTLQGRRRIIVCLRQPMAQWKTTKHKALRFDPECCGKRFRLSAGPPRA